MVKWILLIVIVFILFGCSTSLKRLDETVVYRYNPGNGDLTLKPDYTYAYSATFPHDTSYGHWVVQDHDTILISSEHNLYELSINTAELTNEDSLSGYMISLFDHRDNIIDLNYEQFVVILNQTDTLYSLSNNVWIDKNDFPEIRLIQAGIKMIQPPYRSPAPLTDLLLYKEYSILSQKSNHFTFKLFYEKYLWDYQEFDNTAARVKRNKLILRSGTKFYKQ